MTEKHSAESDAPRHMPCDMGCQPDWHHDDCAIYLPAAPPPSAEKDAGCSYTTSTADYCHKHGGHLTDSDGRCDAA